MTVNIQLATTDQKTAIYSIMALAGEHMHRVLDLSHWYPFPGTDRLLPRMEGRDLYTVYDETLLVGTFNLSTLPEPYYKEDMSDYWIEPDQPAIYFSGFAILPSHQQQGIGTQCMAFVDHFVKHKTTYRYIRFDAVATHPKLIQFYSRLGYVQRGALAVGQQTVMCFEKDLQTHD